MKQLILFGTPSTSTSGGHHLLGMIRYLPKSQDLTFVEVPERILSNGSVVEIKFNTREEVANNYIYTRLFVRELTTDPFKAFRHSLTSASRSLIKGAGATHTYQRNVLVDQLPWAQMSAAVFSGLSYASLLVIGFSLLMLANIRDLLASWRQAIWLVLPPLCLVAIIGISLVFGSLRYTDSAAMGAAFGWNDGFSWTETNRLKFMLEPLLLPFSLVGVAAGMASLRKHVVRKLHGLAR